jgi:hypothetical protein
MLPAGLPCRWTGPRRRPAPRRRPGPRRRSGSRRRLVPAASPGSGQSPSASLHIMCRRLGDLRRGARLLPRILVGRCFVRLPPPGASAASSQPLAPPAIASPPLSSCRKDVRCWTGAPLPPQYLSAAGLVNCGLAP